MNFYRVLSHPLRLYSLAPKDKNESRGIIINKLHLHCTSISKSVCVGTDTFVADILTTIGWEA